MAGVRYSVTREPAARIGALVCGCTLVLTASFLGVVSLTTGAAVGLTDRVPYYVLAMAIAFVAGIVGLEGRRRVGGRRILGAAIGLALTVFAVVGLGTEGVVYAVRSPERVVASQVLVYFLAAGLVGTGIAFWAVRHWRELVPTSSY